MAGVQLNQVVQVHMNIIPRNEKEFIKSKGVLKCWQCHLSDGLVEKNVIKWKIWCCVVLLV